MNSHWTNRPRRWPLAALHNSQTFQACAIPCFTPAFWAGAKTHKTYAHDIQQPMPRTLLIVVVVCQGHMPDIFITTLENGNLLDLTGNTHAQPL